MLATISAGVIRVIASTCCARTRARTSSDMSIDWQGSPKSRIQDQPGAAHALLAWNIGLPRGVRDGTPPEVPPRIASGSSAGSADY